MLEDQVREAHVALMSVHEEIRGEFSGLSSATLRRFLGEFYSPTLTHQVLEHGDAYTLRSVPLLVEDILDTDELVLIVMNYPLLSEDSVFDPHTHLATIPYWQDDKGLRQDMPLSGGGSRSFQFLVWEQASPVHGETEDRAHSNRQLVWNRRPRLKRLIPEQRRSSEHFLMTCKDWLQAQGRKLIVLTNALRSSFDSPIAQLLDDKAVSHIPTKLVGPNRKIMERLMAGN